MRGPVLRLIEGDRGRAFVASALATAGAWLVEPDRLPWRRGLDRVRAGIDSRRTGSASGSITRELICRASET